MTMIRNCGIMYYILYIAKNGVYWRVRERRAADPGKRSGFGSFAQTGPGICFVRFDRNVVRQLAERLWDELWLRTIGESPGGVWRRSPSGEFRTFRLFVIESFFPGGFKGEGTKSKEVIYGDFNQHF